MFCNARGLSLPRFASRPGAPSSTDLLTDRALGHTDEGRGSGGVLEVSRGRDESRLAGEEGELGRAPAVAEDQAPRLKGFLFRISDRLFTAERLSFLGGGCQVPLPPAPRTPRTSLSVCRASRR